MSQRNIYICDACGNEAVGNREVGAPTWYALGDSLTCSLDCAKSLITQALAEPMPTAIDDLTGSRTIYKLELRLVQLRY